MLILNLLRTARTPLTRDESSSLRSVGREGTYFALWGLLTALETAVLFITGCWTSLVVPQSVARFITDVTGVTSVTAGSTEQFVSGWLAPLLVAMVLVIVAVLLVMRQVHRFFQAGRDRVRRWAYRTRPENAVGVETVVGAPSGAAVNAGGNGDEKKKEKPVRSKERRKTPSFRQTRPSRRRK